MTRLHILAEGQAEETFIKRTLEPYLAPKGIQLNPILIWTKRNPAGSGYRGGIVKWNQILSSLKPLTQDSTAWVTTLLDFYGFPEDMPGYEEVLKKGNPREKVVHLQTKISQNIGHQKFIPFLSLHEFEAWMFCAPDVVADHFGQSKLEENMRRVISEAGEPELINQGTSTHPKARLKSWVPSYKESSDGPVIMDKIGITAIRENCPHFNEWLTQLEALPQTV